MRISKTLNEEISSLKQARADCMARFGLTEDEWDVAFFEYGCRLVEFHTEDEQLSREILQENRFWRWWKLQYLIHDKVIDRNCDYFRRKGGWIKTAMIREQFMNALQIASYASN
jgi:hypothetical protein